MRLKYITKYNRDILSPDMSVKECLTFMDAFTTYQRTGHDIIVDGINVIHMEDLLSISIADVYTADMREVENNPDIKIHPAIKKLYAETRSE